MTPEQVLTIVGEARKKVKPLHKVGFQPLPSSLKPGFAKLIEGRNLLRREYLKHGEGGAHESRDFSLDGRLVGDLGELVVAMVSPIVLTGGAGAQFDGHLQDDPTKMVQIRCSLRDDSIAIKHGKGHFVALQLREGNGGEYRIVYDGPANYPWIYVNANKKSGRRISKREKVHTLKPLKLNTWVLLQRYSKDKICESRA